MAFLIPLAELGEGLIAGGFMDEAVAIASETETPLLGVSSESLSQASIAEQLEGQTFMKKMFDTVNTAGSVASIDQLIRQHNNTNNTHPLYKELGMQVGHVYGIDVPAEVERQQRRRVRHHKQQHTGWTAPMSNNDGRHPLRGKKRTRQQIGDLDAQNSSSTSYMTASLDPIAKRVKRELPLQNIHTPRIYQDVRDPANHPYHGHHRNMNLEPISNFPLPSNQNMAHYDINQTVAPGPSHTPAIHDSHRRATADGVVNMTSMLMSIPE